MIVCRRVCRHPFQRRIAPGPRGRSILLASAMLFCGAAPNGGALAQPAPRGVAGASLQTLTNDLGVQLGITYRYNAPEYRRRYALLSGALDAWNRSPQGPAERAAMEAWLTQAIRASMPGPVASMPAPLSFGIERIALPTPTEPRGATPPSPMPLPANTEFSAVTPLPADSGAGVAEAAPVPPTPVEEAPREEIPRVVNDAPVPPAPPADPPREAGLAAAARLWEESPAAAPLDLGDPFTDDPLIGDGDLFAEGGAPSSPITETQPSSDLFADDPPADAPAESTGTPADTLPGEDLFDEPRESGSRDRFAETPAAPPTNDFFADDPLDRDDETGDFFAASDVELPAGEQRRRAGGRDERPTAQKFTALRPESERPAPTPVRSPTVQPPTVQPRLSVDVDDLASRIRGYGEGLRGVEASMAAEPSANAFQLAGWTRELERLGEQRRFLLPYLQGIAAQQPQWLPELDSADHVLAMLASRLAERRGELGAGGFAEGHEAERILLDAIERRLPLLATAHR